MNNIARRIIAGVSAAALFVSAVGSDAFIGIFGREIYAASATGTGKLGKSTGFSNLEQDTYYDTAGNLYYNTGYGLHTNKTASVAKDSTDGRTFDVNLESWYVGENPVDVATILDASGSMAWTVDTLEPLMINTNSDNYASLGGKYGTIGSIEDLQEIQKNNGGYLPQDVVDCILNPANTDNSKLSYSKYMYYVYEARSSVSEFVPLGYWDGGKSTGIAEPIGYYPFNGSLINEITGGEAKYIQHPAEGSAYDPESMATQKAEVIYTGSNGIDISKTAPVGAVKLDLKENTGSDRKLVIKTDIGSNATDTSSTNVLYDDTVILYITDGKNFIKIYRGDKHLNEEGKPSNSTNRLRIVTNVTPNGEYLLNANSVFSGKGTAANEFTFTFDFVNQTLNIKTTTAVNLDNTVGTETSYTIDSDNEKNEYIPADFDLTNLQIYIGGSTESINNYSEVFVSSVNVEVGDTQIAKYNFKSKSLKNSANDDTEAILVQQAYNNSGNFGVEAISDIEAKPTFEDGALNVSKTAKNGAILLDVNPDETYTISFKVKADNPGNNTSAKGCILYVYDTKSSDYYTIFRDSAGSKNRLRIREKELTDNVSDLNSIFNGKWQTITYVIDGESLLTYNGSTTDNTPKTLTGTYSDLSLIIAGLWDQTYGSSSNDTDIYIDDLYVYDTALTSDEVAKTIGTTTGTGTKGDDCNKYHAVSEGGQELAQISDRLANNPYDSQRRGWYYVNSHSTWEDIEGCLESGKQFVGIYTDEGLTADMAKDIVTIPYGMETTLQQSIKDYENDPSTTKHADYVPPTTERSIRFYVDGQNHLRCFVWSGSDTKNADDARTFCSLVYQKKDKQQTKYEALNGALNTFYQNLAEKSELSNTALVRFSTNNAVGNLNRLIMKDWTNYSDVYKDNNSTQRNEYLQDLLIPADGETSANYTSSTARPDIKEYPYVMTGGTYTWTGLKAFYDYMVKTKSDYTGDGFGAPLESGNKVYNIANDARDKYLIIFTDGRDNTVEQTNPATGSHTNNADQTPDGTSAGTNSKLAKLWADKLKEEGYTIYCVMMATGSISEDTNTDEYTRAKNFLKTLAGANEGDESDLTGAKDDTVNQYIRVVGNDSSSLTDAFKEILERIQQPRDDYTVQDYIDPRFDLIDEKNGLLKLGANGVITDSEGKTLATVGNIIDDSDATGYLYTPIESENVTEGDGKDCYIYYDDVKDMYYLRWTKQVIPMENEAFDTDTSDPKKYLNVWSATIRLKAKDDFIGGNNILTNGNEAGENLVYSDATIENMDKNPDLYFTTEELGEFSKDPEDKYVVPYRKKLEALSGTNRKINAVDAGGVSQAVYGDGIDIPSSGFPRTTVNVRLLQLDANNLNDVIYMGEVVSPTMMLADLENGYMTGSYYLQYLERYAYRVYGEDATKKPLLELLNQWLKINVKEEESKTFTIPYIYLPDPEYEDDGTFKEFTNSTGADKVDAGEDIYEELNLRDVTGFITYTWKRNNEEKQQEITVDGEIKHDITKEYVVKNTDQIVYNLQLKFTPLKDEQLAGFTLDENFITDDKFFKVEGNEFFNDGTVSAWDITDTRSDYLKAMVSETTTYEPHVMYDSEHEKWVLVDDTSDDFTPAKAVEAYTVDEQTVSVGGNKVTDSGVYDWDTDYKKVAGEKQIEGDKLKDYYTKTPQNVVFADQNGDTITDDEGGFLKDKTASDVYSLVANTTYIKDVVNAALALELFVDGKYLKADSLIRQENKTFTFEATRYYDDPLEPLPYDPGTELYADTGKTDPATGKVEGKKYQLTFTVDKTSLPDDPQENVIYKVWAHLSEVKVANVAGSGYEEITGKVKETDGNHYLGYEKIDALPIGTYVISIDDSTLETNDFKIGTDEGTDVFFKYLKTDSTSTNYTHDKFPDSVSSVSETAVESTGDGEYLIYNNVTKTDNSSKNIAENEREVIKDPENQTVRFYFGTVDDIGKKGESTKDHLTELVDGKYSNEYTKDRLGIMLLSVDPNSLAISKEVTNTTGYTDKFWQFTVTFTPKDEENKKDFEDINNADGFDLQWYKDSVLTEATEMGADYPKVGGGKDFYPSKIKFDEGSGDTYTATIYLKHKEKVVIKGLQDGTWQVEEVKETDLLYTPHNNMIEDIDGESWRYVNANATREDIELQPASAVEYVNEFPYNLPSAGGIGTNILIYSGITFMLLSGLSFAILCRRGRSRDKPKG